MKKIINLKNGDFTTIVSLSAGILGESFCDHQREIGIRRLKEFGLEVKYAPNSLKGIKYISDHPESRADDLIWAINDKETKLILCALGGDDTYRLTPYLLDNIDYKNTIKNTNKIFLGYSDTTINHLIFNKLNVPSFYGVSFLTDLAELDSQMLDYTKNSFANLFKEDKMIYKPSKYWYEERNDFGLKQINVPRIKHTEDHNYLLLQGKSYFYGTLIGGCLESLADLFIDEKKRKINVQYDLFTNKTNFKNKVLLLETCELKLPPNEIELMLQEIAKTGCFDNLEGVIIGKPQNEKYFEEYKNLFSTFFSKYKNLSVVYNINIGHAYPKMILQLLGKIEIDVNNQEIISHKA
ncbi:carboxypeptidase [[Mycoplasma] phocae]|uniref:Carboxypeptidase n=1 Tax=[Mycoplasma] phocae TaxID=142651 RepID=A0A2Z5IQA2_9BACT|nr:S66 peptidase family protein [[Mycoplasma] phocae]AXE60712.1 carboxypeptidase [[Mycoplasma] phocae]